MTARAYYLGCPVWACDRWKGRLFTHHAPRAEWLGQYSSVFNCVEGNSTFYAVPPDQTVRRWVAGVQPGFRFALKFPRAISHEKRLLDCAAETRGFLRVLELLAKADCLGPSFLQLPRGFTGYHLDDLGRYLRGLPREYPYAVELRHRDFFDRGEIESALDELLAELHVDRVILDSRALFSAPPDDAAEQISQSRKPRLPVHTSVTGAHPLLRFVGRNDVRRTVPWIREWSGLVAKWINSGLRPFVFCHTPDELYAPEFARAFHAELQRHTDRVDSLPTWSGETEPGREKQLELF